MIKDYFLQNWPLILILTAFAIVLKTTIFLEKKVIRRMYVLIIAVFLLSVVVYIEFLLEALNKAVNLRLVMIAIRYSATPFILAQIIFTLIKKQKIYIFIPAFVLAIIDIVSIFTGIVFSLDENDVFKRGPLGYIPYIVAGIYGAILIYLLIKNSNKRSSEIVPIIFLCGSFLSCLIFPFIFKKHYSQIFCSTIAISLFVYYVFQILQLTKKDPLTGVLNRQAYYSDIANDSKDITALISLDMNGLKETNDTYGHAAGDEALSTLAACFLKSCKSKQYVYRVGGDEFIILCRQATYGEMICLIERINKNVDESKYSVSIGYSYSKDGEKDIDQLLKESDEMMYSEKTLYYKSKEK